MIFRWFWGDFPMILRFPDDFQMIIRWFWGDFQMILMLFSDFMMIFRYDVLCYRIRKKCTVDKKWFLPKIYSNNLFKTRTTFSLKNLFPTSNLFWYFFENLISNVFKSGSSFERRFIFLKNFIQKQHKLILNKKKQTLFAARFGML